MQLAQMFPPYGAQGVGAVRWFPRISVIMRLSLTSIYCLNCLIRSLVQPNIALAGGNMAMSLCL